MMEARVTQGFQTWRVPPANGEGLALELAGLEGCLRVRAWVEDGRDMIELVRPVVGTDEATLIYHGPLAELSVLMTRAQEKVCPGCGHRWTPRVSDPAKCPECSYRLRRPRQGRRRSSPEPQEVSEE